MLPAQLGLFVVIEDNCYCGIVCWAYTGEIVEPVYFVVNIDVCHFFLVGIASKVAKPVPVLREIYIELCQRFCFNNETVILKPCRISFQVFQYLFRIPPKNIRTTSNQDKTSEGNRKKDEYTLVYKAVSTYRTLGAVEFRLLRKPTTNPIHQAFLRFILQATFAVFKVKVSVAIFLSPAQSQDTASQQENSN